MSTIDLATAKQHLPEKLHEYEEPIRQLIDKLGQNADLYTDKLPLMLQTHMGITRVTLKRIINDEANHVRPYRLDDDIPEERMPGLKRDAIEYLVKHMTKADLKELTRLTPDARKEPGHLNKLEEQFGHAINTIWRAKKDKIDPGPMVEEPEYAATQSTSSLLAENYTVAGDDEDWTKSQSGERQGKYFRTKARSSNQPSYRR